MEDDLDVVIAALNEWARHRSELAYDAVDIAAVNNRLLGQLRKTSVEEWAVAMEEAQRRFGR